MSSHLILTTTMNESQRKRDDEIQFDRASLALNNIGVSLLEKGAYQQALDTFKDAIATIKLLVSQRSSADGNEYEFSSGNRAAFREKVDRASKRLAQPHALSSNDDLPLDLVCLEDLFVHSIWNDAIADITTNPELQSTLSVSGWSSNLSSSQSSFDSNTLYLTESTFIEDQDELDTVAGPQNAAMEQFRDSNIPAEETTMTQSSLLPSQISSFQAPQVKGRAYPVRLAASSLPGDVPNQPISANRNHDEKFTCSGDRDLDLDCAIMLYNCGLSYFCRYQFEKNCREDHNHQSQRQRLWQQCRKLFYMAYATLSNSCKRKGKLQSPSSLHGYLYVSIVILHGLILTELEVGNHQIAIRCYQKSVKVGKYLKQIHSRTVNDSAVVSAPAAA